MVLYSVLLYMLDATHCITNPNATDLEYQGPPNPNAWRPWIILVVELDSLDLLLSPCGSSSLLSLPHLMIPLRSVSAPNALVGVVAVFLGPLCSDHMQRLTGDVAGQHCLCEVWLCGRGGGTTWLLHMSLWLLVWGHVS